MREQWLEVLANSYPGAVCRPSGNYFVEGADAGAAFMEALKEGSSDSKGRVERSLTRFASYCPGQLEAARQAVALVQQPARAVIAQENAAASAGRAAKEAERVARGNAAEE